MRVVVQAVVMALLAGTAGAQAGVSPADRGDGVICLGEPATIVSDKGFIRGTGGPDVIVSTRTGLIEAGGGGDRICARAAGFTEVYGDAGDDRILTGEGGQNIYGGPGNDRVRSGPGRDLITDTEPTGNDTYDAGSDRDTIRFSVEGSCRAPAEGVEVDLALGFATGRGRDRLFGVDSVEGTFGQDVISGSPGSNVLDGIRGGDLIFGEEGDDVIRGATRRLGEGGQSGDPPGDDRLLSGGRGDDRVLGRYGADRLAGGEGADVLLGGAGIDRGDGGRGADVCRGLEDIRGCESP